MTKKLFFSALLISSLIVSAGVIPQIATASDSESVCTVKSSISGGAKYLHGPGTNVKITAMPGFHQVRTDLVYGEYTLVLPPGVYTVGASNDRGDNFYPKEIVVDLTNSNSCVKGISFTADY